MNSLLKYFSIVPLIISVACSGQSLPVTDCLELLNKKPEFYSDGFDFPVGKPGAKGYYNAQGFRKNNHLGEDWNGTGGGNTDLGDPIFAAANGKVVSAKNEGPGWGNVIRIIHVIKQDKGCKTLETIYAHLKEMKVQNGDLVKRGQNIGSMGNADGAYPAHLHFELRNDCNMEIGGGYAMDASGFLNPTDYIRKHRPKE